MGGLAGMLTGLQHIQPGDHPEFFRDLGRYAVAKASSYEAALASSIWSRLDKYEQQFRDDFSGRLGGGATDKHLGEAMDEEAFKYSNLSLNIGRATTRYLAAKSYDEVFGSMPWFSAIPVGPEDKDKATLVESFLKWKLEDSNAQFETSAKTAITNAWALGYQPVKVSPTEKRKTFQKVVTVLVDSSGNPVMHNFAGEGEPPRVESVYDSTPKETSDALIEEDPSRTWGAFFEEVDEVEYSGPEVRTLHHRSFVFDMTKPELEDCELYGEYRDVPMMELLSTYPKGVADDFDVKLADLLETAGRSSGEPADRANKPTGTEAASAPVAGWRDEKRLEERVPCFEGVVKYLVPNPNGRDKDYVQLWVLIARESGEVIWADYLHNVQDRSPYTLVTSDRFPNRAYGPGIYERYDSTLQYIDVMFNTMHFRNRLASNPAVAIDMDAFEETKAGNPFRLAPGKHYQLTGGKSIDEAIQVMQLPQMEEMSQYLMELAMQTLSQDTGVSPAAQGDITALPQMNTATGVKQVLNHGNVLGKMAIREIQRGLQEVLKTSSKVALRDLDQPQSFHYLGGKEAKEVIQATVGPDEAAIELDIRLLLTRFNEEQEITQADRQMEVYYRYIELPPHRQESARALVAEQLKTLGYKDPEELLKTDEELGHMQEPGPAGGGGMGSPQFNDPEMTPQQQQIDQERKLAAAVDKMDDPQIPGTVPELR